MKSNYLCFVAFLGLVQAISCSQQPKQEPNNGRSLDTGNNIEKKSYESEVDSFKKDIFTTANTSGNFSEGQGSDKKRSTEKPNRTGGNNDLTQPFQAPVEFVDETTDPAFDYSSPNECEIILTDTLQ